MSAPRESAAAELRELAAEYRIGALVNAIDSIGVQYGGDALPPSAHRAAVSLQQLLAELGLTELAGSNSENLARAARVWSDAP